MLTETNESQLLQLGQQAVEKLGKQQMRELEVTAKIEFLFRPSITEHFRIGVGKDKVVVTFGAFPLGEIGAKIMRDCIWQIKRALESTTGSPLAFATEIKHEVSDSMLPMGECIIEAYKVVKVVSRKSGFVVAKYGIDGYGTYHKLTDSARAELMELEGLINES